MNPTSKLIEQKIQAKESGLKQLKSQHAQLRNQLSDIDRNKEVLKGNMRQLEDAIVGAIGALNELKSLLEGSADAPNEKEPSPNRVDDLVHRADQHGAIPFPTPGEGLKGLSDGSADAPNEKEPSGYLLDCGKAANPGKFASHRQADDMGDEQKPEDQPTGSGGDDDK